jgi:hypothetical protein
VLHVLAASVAAAALPLGACRDAGRDGGERAVTGAHSSAPDDGTAAGRPAPRRSGGEATPARSGEANARSGEADAPPPAMDDRLVEQFRAVERAAIASYTEALAEQRANRIDELELAQVIERDVLEPWRAIRARVTATTVPAGRDALYRTLARYLEARQISWEAYVSSLRAPDEQAARRHLDVHRQRNAEAQATARELGQLFREATAGGDARSP